MSGACITIKSHRFLSNCRGQTNGLCRHFYISVRNLQSFPWLRERTGLMNEAGISTALVMQAPLITIGADMTKIHTHFF